MLKKSVIVCSCLACLSVLADAEYELKSAKQPQTAFVAPKYTFKNPSAYQIATEDMDNLKKEIKVNTECKQVTNAQQMYDLVTKIRASVRNPNTLALLDVMRSFLRRQDNRMPLKDLMPEVDKLISALQWLNTANNRNNDSSFYDKTEHIAVLVNPEYFIHLNKEQMQRCLKFTTKMKDAANISSINDDVSAEDGVALTSVMFEKERNIAQQVLTAVNSLEKKTLAFGEKISSLSKEELTKRIEEFSKFIDAFKTTKITVDDEQILLSKNMVRHLRIISGGVMNKLQETLNQLQ